MGFKTEVDLLLGVKIKPSEFMDIIINIYSDYLEGKCDETGEKIGKVIDSYQDEHKIDFTGAFEDSKKARKFCYSLYIACFYQYGLDIDIEENASDSKPAYVLIIFRSILGRQTSALGEEDPPLFCSMPLRKLKWTADDETKLKLVEEILQYRSLTPEIILRTQIT